MERRDAAGRDQVLDHEIDERERQQDEEGPAAGNQVFELGVEADAGEEIEQQHVARLEREAHLDAKHDIDDQRRRGGEQPPGHGLRDVPGLQRLDRPVEAGADEEHEDRDGKAQEPGNLKTNAPVSRHRAPAL